MGFFSSRRAELSETPLHDDKNVVRVIRSRFYGKAKGKERDAGSDSNSRSPQSLSSPTFVHSGDRNSFVSTHDSGNGGPSRTTRWNGSSTPSIPASLFRRADVGVNVPTPRVSTDAVTITLAQRLNELATANSDGLLSDDEYRLLRQNLFERFASGSAVPTEAPLVRMSGSHMVADGRTSFSAAHERRPSSNFQIPSSRTQSIRSNRSLTSTVTSLLRRATSKRVIPPSEGGSDAMSIFSVVSSMASSAVDGGGPLPRTLSKHTSEGSIRTSMHYPRQHAYSEQTTDFGELVNRSHSDTRSRQRSGSSAPPSSFPGATAALDAKYTHISEDGLPDDDLAETVKDIRTQIELVEAEGRRLLDAFNGLELSTLTRRQRRPPIIPPLSLGNPIDVSSMNSPDRRSLRAGKDVDSLSFKSSGSIRTTRSVKRSPSYRKIRTVPSTGTLVAQSNTLPHRGSISSMSSRGKAGGATLQSHLGLASSSSVNLTWSTGHLPLATVRETEGKPNGRAAVDLPASASAQSTAAKSASAAEDEEIKAMEVELTDIRRRRAEVTARYEARLEYLRARLKGAELREKILRK